VLTQSPARIDFARNVQPILKASCVGCHGGAEPSGGYRLDRRSAALAGAIRPMIIPGSSDSSRLIRRVMGSEFGTRMPLSGALPPEEIETLRRWIDEGAEWPDALANESPAPVPDEAAIRLSDAIRARDSDRVGSLIAGNPQAINARGHGGTTPLMYAALYGDPGLLRRMLG
jgi:hypothetical protein